MFYHDDTVRARQGAVYNGITRIRNGSCKFRDLLPLLTNRSVPVGAKRKLYSVFERSLIHHRSKTCLVKEEDVIKLQRNDTKMVS